MKINLLSALITLLAATAQIANTKAQQPDNRVAAEFRTIHLQKSTEPDLEKDFFTAAREAGIDIRTVRDFSTRFGFVENVSWLKAGDGTLAYFTSNGIKTRAAYNRYGRWMYNLRTLTEHQFPRYSRSQVKSVYYDHEIISVEEITNISQKYYIVHLHDKKSWINVRLVDGEMEVLEDLTEPS